MAFDAIGVHTESGNTTLDTNGIYGTSTRDQANLHMVPNFQRNKSTRTGLVPNLRNSRVHPGVIRARVRSRCNWKDCSFASSDFGELE
jgi:hypothetical protein